MSGETIVYSIVIPVYESGEWMDELVARIGAVMEIEAPGKFELILVNDCSPDLITWPAIVRNAKKYKWVRGFNLLFNVHQFKATICGMEQARGEFILTMDDDLQHLPEELPKLIRAMREDDQCLCIMGRYDSKKHSLFRNLGSRFYQAVTARFYGKPAGIQTTSFRIIRRELSEAIINYRTNKPQMGPLTVALTPKLKNIPVQHACREHGHSGYSILKLISATFDNVIQGTTAPLRIFSILGFFSALVSLIFASFFTARWLGGGIGVAGYTSQMLLVCFFGGMTLSGIGLVGEYVARIISEVTGTERFKIKDQTEEVRI